MKGRGVQFERRAGKAGPWEAITEAEARTALSALFADTDPAVFCMVDGGDIIPTPTAYLRARPAAH
jgi:hypothetical protein